MALQQHPALLYRDAQVLSSVIRFLEPLVDSLKSVGRIQDLRLDPVISYEYTRLGIVYRVPHMYKHTGETRHSEDGGEITIAELRPIPGAELRGLDLQGDGVSAERDGCLAFDFSTPYHRLALGLLQPSVHWLKGVRCINHLTVVLNEETANRILRTLVYSLQKQPHFFPFLSSLICLLALMPRALVMVVICCWRSAICFW